VSSTLLVWTKQKYYPSNPLWLLPARTLHACGGHLRQWCSSGLACWLWSSLDWSWRVHGCMQEGLRRSLSAENWLVSRGSRRVVKVLNWIKPPAASVHAPKRALWLFVRTDLLSLLWYTTVYHKGIFNARESAILPWDERGVVLSFQFW
jgi:hypothetical protein